MEKEFHFGNRQRLYGMLENRSLLVLFAGQEIRKSADAMYLFYADRNFVYLTGIEQKESVLLAQKDEHGEALDRAAAEWGRGGGAVRRG